MAFLPRMEAWGVAPSLGSSRALLKEMAPPRGSLCHSFTQLLGKSTWRGNLVVPLLHVISPPHSVCVLNEENISFLFLVSIDLQIVAGCPVLTKSSAHPRLCLKRTSEFSAYELWLSAPSCHSSHPENLLVLSSLVRSTGQTTARCWQGKQRFPFISTLRLASGVSRAHPDVGEYLT